MPAKTSRRQRSAPAGATGQEALYLRFLSEKQVPVNVKLRDGELVSGWIEYFDDAMIRLTREGKPNLFIYKQHIRTISELVRKEESKRRTARRKEEAAGAGVATTAAGVATTAAGVLAPENRAPEMHAVPAPEMHAVPAPDAPTQEEPSL